MLGKVISMNTMKQISNILLVFFGGGLGSAIRYFFSIIIKNSSNGFPTATFLVNVTGCFIIGLIYSLIQVENTALKLWLVVGVLGGFTTFSSFGLETIHLFGRGQSQIAILYVILSNLFGLAAVYIGTRISLLFS
jgi:CrcB protein